MDEARRDYENMCRRLPEANQAGMRIIVGDDYGVITIPHGDYADELEFYVKEIGIPPLDVIQQIKAPGTAIQDLHVRRQVHVQESLGHVHADPLVPQEEVADAQDEDAGPLFPCHNRSYGMFNIECSMLTIQPMDCALSNYQSILFISRKGAKLAKAQRITLGRPLRSLRLCERNAGLMLIITWTLDIGHSILDVEQSPTDTGLPLVSADRQVSRVNA